MRGEGEFWPKRTYFGEGEVEGGSSKTNKDKQGGEGGSKLGNLERTCFLNVPFWNIYWQTKSHSLNTSCKAHNILQYGKILTKLLSFIFRIIKPLLSVFFNHCNLIVSAIYKASACKKFKNYRFETSLFFYLRKLIPLS